MGEAARNSSALHPATLRDDMAIYDQSGTRLGKVTEVMLDMTSGQIEFAVISFGGFLGLGQKYHPLPFQLLHLRDPGDGFIVNADTALIDGSPAYRLDDAPVFDSSYGERLRSYYGIKRDAETGRLFHALG
ncbi:MAG: PRC-barrel domain-containing protein [Chakrabartia sp.]